MKPMRLLELCSIFGMGGITRHVMDLTTWMRDRGHHVTMGGSPGAWLDTTRDATFCELSLNQVTDEGGGRVSRIMNAMRSAQKVRRLVREQKIQLIHAHESAPAIVAGLATIGTGVPVAVTYHGADPSRVAWFGTVARRAADRVITPSHNCARDLREIGRVPHEKLTVIGYGIELQPPCDEHERDRLRASLLEDGEEFLIVTVTRLTHQKGIDTLIEAVRKIVDQRKDMRFVVVGDGPQEQDVQKWVAAAGVGSRMTFVGRSDNPHLYMAAGDALLLTSRWEALPLTIVEAFRQGMPVIGTDCSGVSEMVDDTVGRVVPIGDIEAIVQAVLDIVPDKHKREQLSENAIVRSQEDRFTLESVHQSFERTYREMLDQK